MKKIWIDMSHYNKLSGYWVVAKNIIDHMLQYDNFEFFLFSNEDISLPESIKKDNIHIVVNKWISYIYYRMRHQAKVLKEHHIDTFFTCDQIVPLRKVCRYISTIHDMFLWLNFWWLKALKILKPNWWDKKRFLYHLLGFDKLFAIKSDYIISPSEYTKKDVIKCLWLNEKKIVVAHWGIDNIKKIKQTSKQDYILFPLCTIFHDNFIFALWKRILELHMTKKIIYWKPWNLWSKMTYKNTDPNIEVIQKRISEEEKEKLIAHAKIAIYVSPFEWFWFVPLECLRLWAPLIYNNVGSLWEVIGESAIGINKMDIEKYIQWISEIHKYPNEYIEKWLEKSDTYLWSETVKKIVSKF